MSARQEGTFGRVIASLLQARGGAVIATLRLERNVADAAAAVTVAVVGIFRKDSDLVHLLLLSSFIQGGIKEKT